MKITLDNYQNTAGSVDVSQLSKEDKGIHELLLKFGAGMIDDDTDAETIAEVNDLLATVNNLVNGSSGGSQAPKAKAAPKAPKAPKTPAAPKAKATPKPKTPKAPAAPKTPKAVAAPKAVTGGNVRGISKAVSLIKGFVTLLNSGHTRAYVEGKLRGIQRAMLDGTITKSTKHAAIVDECQDLLIKAVKNWKARADTKIQLEVGDEATRNKMIGIAGGETVFESVAVLKAYVGLTAQSKPVTQAQLDNLLKRTASPKITAADPFKDEIKAVQVALKAAKPGKISISAPVGLSGVHKSVLTGVPALTRSLDSWAAKGRGTMAPVKKKARKVKPAPRTARPRKATASRRAAPSRRPFVAQQRLTAEW